MDLDLVKEAFAPSTVKVEVIVHGEGLGMLLRSNSGQQEKLKKTDLSGVKFVAYEKTMKRKRVAMEDLFQFVSTVDAGVAEVVRKQEA